MVTKIWRMSGVLIMSSKRRFMEREREREKTKKNVKKVKKKKREHVFFTFPTCSFPNVFKRLTATTNMNITFYVYMYVCLFDHKSHLMKMAHGVVVKGHVKVSCLTTFYHELILLEARVCKCPPLN